jgi:hypothetical protein
MQQSHLSTLLQWAATCFLHPFPGQFCLVLVQEVNPEIISVTSTWMFTKIQINKWPLLFRNSLTRFLTCSLFPWPFLVWINCVIHINHWEATSCCSWIRKIVPPYCHSFTGRVKKSLWRQKIHPRKTANWILLLFYISHISLSLSALLITNESWEFLLRWIRSNSEQILEYCPTNTSCCPECYVLFCNWLGHHFSLRDCPFSSLKGRCTTVLICVETN